MEGTETVTFSTAFIAGLLSFLTPCVLPLVPVYLSILSGATFDQLTGKGGELTADERKAIHRQVISNALAFIAGFSIIFIVSGVVAGSLGDWLISTQNQYGHVVTNWLIVIFGVILVFLGINMAGFWKPAFLNTEAKFKLQKGKWGVISSGLIGAAFAFGWTPCVGPFLASIWMIAAQSGSRLEGALLLAVYSLGLGIPFFLSALSVNGLIAFTSKYRRYFHIVEVVVGSVLIIVGLGLAIPGIIGMKNNTNGLNIYRSMLERNVVEVEVDGNGQDNQPEGYEISVVPAEGMDLSESAPPEAGGPVLGD